VRQLSSYLNPALHSVMSHVEKLLNMNVTLQSVLPAAWRSVCFVADFQKGCLTIGVIDAVWLTALRYELPMLRDRLRQEVGWHGLASIQLKVQPFAHEFEKTKKLRIKYELSNVAQEALCKLRQLVQPVVTLK